MGAEERRGDLLEPAWEELLRGLEPDLRAYAREAPCAIGLPVGGEAAAWDRFVQLAPNRALPRFAVPDAHAARFPRDVVTRFVRAHHHAAFFGVVADRIADAQTARDPRLSALRRALLRAWEDALADALRDRAAARRAIAADLRAWRDGLRRERAAFARGSVDPAEYFDTVAVRLRWVSTSARAMLAARGLDAEAAGLRRACDLFLFACQCRDDALDADEDRARGGACVADLLGLSPGALVRAAAQCVARASTEAARHGFGALRAWLDDFAREADVWWPGEDPRRQSFGAMALLGALP